MYKRKEIIGDCTLYLGDARDILPTLEGVDAIVTDPPYGIGAYSNGHMGGGVLAKRSEFKKTEWDFSPINKDMIDAIIKSSKYQIIFGGNYFELPPTSCYLVWDKDNGNNNFADCELAWTNLKKAVRLIKWRWQGMLQQDMKNKDVREHPTQKPVEVMKWCLSHLPESAKVIADPFMGSGTTLVACAKTGRKGIGIEIDTEYFEIACQRVREAYMQPDLFI